MSFTGFLLSAGQFSTNDVPGAIFTGNTSIDPQGDVLGRYIGADGHFHGFLLSGPAEGRQLTRVAHTSYWSP